MKNRFSGRAPFGNRNKKRGHRDAPMRKLLSSVNADGKVFVDYEQQWRTFNKAQRLGFVDDDYNLTQAGREWLAQHTPVEQQPPEVKTLTDGLPWESDHYNKSDY